MQLAEAWTGLSADAREMFEQQASEAAAAHTEAVATHVAEMETFNAELKAWKGEKAAAKRKSLGLGDDNDDSSPAGKKSKRGPSHDGTCTVCEETGLLVECEGGCSSAFHPGCIGLGCIPESIFRCDSCTTGNTRCFLCDDPGGPSEPLGELRKCDDKSCRKRFHLSCAKNLPRTKFNTTEVYGERFICPQHTCANCDLPVTTQHMAVRCIRCPVVYHELCIPAGAEMKERFRCVCPRHVLPGKHPSSPCCVVCGDGGELICCDGCPNTYHTKCVENAVGFTKPAEGQDWFCTDCVGGSKAMEHDIVWAKVGTHRWWPSQIMPQSEIPELVSRKAHDQNTFPIHFLGSTDYQWVNYGSVIPWSPGDEKGKFAQGTKKPAFKRAIEAGIAEYTKRLESRAPVLEEIKGKIKAKPVEFHRIRANNYVCKKPRKQETTECECTAEEGSRCGEDCLNRIMFIECDPKTCPAGKFCQNKRMLKRAYAKIKEFKTENDRGWGLKPTEDLKPGDFVVEYVGEVITTEMCRERLAKQDKFGSESFYMLALDHDHIIDARLKANQARFANHSCDPNCITQKWTINGEGRVGIFARKHIPAGEELTFNYQLDCLDNKKKKCYCGAAICSGFIGSKPKEEVAAPKKGRGKKKKGPSKVKLQENFHEEYCYNCSDDGALLMCDHAKCPKVYCMQCLGIEKAPHGKWLCPWHHCDHCGKKSKIFCTTCPNSFCSLDHVIIDANNTLRDPALGPLADPIRCWKCLHDDDLEAKSPALPAPQGDEAASAAEAEVAAVAVDASAAAAEAAVEAAVAMEE